MARTLAAAFRRLVSALSDLEMISAALPEIVIQTQVDVVQMLVSGLSNKKIGAPLGIVERTVKAQVAKLMRKIGVHNRIELSVYAVARSLVTLPAN